MHKVLVMNEYEFLASSVCANMGLLALVCMQALDPTVTAETM